VEVVMQNRLRLTVGAFALAVPLVALATACSDKTFVDQVNVVSPLALTDAEVLGILHQSNVNEINAANLALTNASDTGVVAFAHAEVTDHTALDQQGQALANSLGITPTLRDSALVAAGAAELARLQGLTGSTFDRAYIDGQVTSHQATLAFIDSTAQVATNSSIRSFLLNTERPVIAANLAHAQSIQARIGQ
jgi:putative membrane protein